MLVTGGAGYIGAVLVPRLLDLGYEVRVLDLYLYGKDVFSNLKGRPGFEEIEGDIRDPDAIARSLEGVDAVIHFACISNDPSCELDPELTRKINLDAFEPIVKEANEQGVRRFIFASSSSVYGISDNPNVREDHPRKPITAYNQFKGCARTSSSAISPRSSRRFPFVRLRSAEFRQGSVST